MELPNNRIVVIHNEHSSDAARFYREVQRPLEQERRRMHGLEFLATPSADHRVNAAAIAESVDDGDVVMVAGGDGTQHAGLNGVLLSEKEIACMGVLGFGNINDAAVALNGWRRRRDVSIVTMANDNRHIVPFKPMEIYHDNQFLTHAMLYATAGQTARIAYEFTHGKARQQLLRGRHGIMASMLQAAHMQLVKGRKKEFDGALPPVAEADGSTDIAFINSPVMARMFRTNQDLFTTDEFLETHFNFPPGRVLGTLKQAGRIAMSPAFGLPGRMTSAGKIEYDLPHGIWLQVDGESEHIEAQSIGAKKRPDGPTVPMLRVQPKS